MDVDGCFVIPLSFVCRTGLHDFGELVGKGLQNVIDNDPFEGYDEYYMREYIDNPFSQWFLSDEWTFLFSLVNRAEFKVGFTPGNVYGDGKVYPSSYGVFAGEDRYCWSGVRGTEIGSRFCLTTDTTPQKWQFSMSFSLDLML